MYRVIEVKDLKTDYGTTENLYVLQRRRLFGGWRHIFSSSSQHRVIEKFYEKAADKQELDEVVLRAVQKAFQEKEKDFKNMATQVEGMFSKKSTGIITAVATILVTLASSLSSVYATLDSVGNCTK